MSLTFRENFKKVLSVIFFLSFIFVLISVFIFEGEWPFISFSIVAGMFIAFVQDRKRAKNFILNSLIGSFVFGILASFLMFFRVYVSEFFSEYPMPFSNLWEDSGRLMLTTSMIVLSFLGSLAGVVFKGLYSLYGRRLDAIIIVVGPIILSFFSLFVAKVKIGGTLMSIYYGWPYPLLIHQVRDVIDGFLVDKWIISLGSLYHYLIFDYLLFFIIFIFVFIFIKVINQKKLILNSTYVLFGILVFGIISFNSYLPLRQNYIFKEIVKGGYCEIDSDCIGMDGSCPFGCFVSVNKKEEKRIDSLIKSFPCNCVYGCTERQAVRCINKKCSFDY